MDRVTDATRSEASEMAGRLERFAGMNGADTQTCAGAARLIRQLEAERVELRSVAWTDAFGTTQLTHATAKLDAAVRQAAERGREVGRLEAERLAWHRRAWDLARAWRAEINMNGVDHDEDGCPEDDTCKCENIAEIQKAIGTDGLGLGERP